MNGVEMKDLQCSACRRAVSAYGQLMLLPMQRCPLHCDGHAKGARNDSAISLYLP
jgi:hypothetical protein